jgi:hypothetical protein
MRDRVIVFTLALTAVAVFTPMARAQTAVAPARGGTAGANFSSKVPDLSGSWLRAKSQISVSPSDLGGAKRGKEDDIPYSPAGLQMMLAERPPTGSNGQPATTTDPWINYCEPPGLVRIYQQPGRTKFLQTENTVYILHEVMQQFRMVRLNSKHPDDPDPTWWGDSIGWYENGDTLVIDTIGTNGKTWLDQIAHPTTEKLHLIERYKRVDAKTLDLDITIDDAGAYARPFKSSWVFQQTAVPFMQNPWVCSVRENTAFRSGQLTPADTPGTK